MDLLSATLKRIPEVDPALERKAQARIDNLTKPVGSLGRLEEIARRLVAITGSETPSLERKVVFTFAGDHGVTEEGVSAYPREVTAQMVLNFLRGGAGINVLARHAGAEVVVIDIGVDHDFSGTSGLRIEKVVRGTRNFTKGPAMTREEAVRCVEVGIRLAGEHARAGFHIFGTGDMGIGNTTPSAAIAAVMTGVPATKVTGRGTGIGDEAFARKVLAIQRGIDLNAPDPRDPIAVLAKVGGAEIGGIAGIIIGAAANRVPVVVDGFISTAGALVAERLDSRTADFMFAAHRSVEPGHAIMMEAMRLQPILDLGMRLGEGTGAALAMTIIEASLKIYKEMASFDQAGVSRKTD
ncbi:MAG: nicotinate-nucleotide--dimethylbenzimidazole phosphoribosyltransferase [Deltaproteobacteria bacterium]|nr:nicotinate-nucleotide--dimethylbenzimidazole phosphoribosyltransferase [Deltaproteobacteria bacterium]